MVTVEEKAESLGRAQIKKEKSCILVILGENPVKKPIVWISYYTCHQKVN